MKALIIVAILAAVALYIGLSVSRVYRAQAAVTDRIDHQLDLVDEQSIESARTDLKREIEKLDLELEVDPSDIVVKYADTTEQTYAQRVVARKVADIKNKKAEISVRYTIRFLGFGRQQDIYRSKIRQIEVRQKMQQSPAYDELLK